MKKLRIASIEFHPVPVGQQPDVRLCEHHKIITVYDFAGTIDFKDTGNFERLPAKELSDLVGPVSNQSSCHLIPSTVLDGNQFTCPKLSHNINYA